MKTLLKFKLVVVGFLALFSTTIYAQTFNIELNDISIDYRVISEIHQEIGIVNVSTVTGDIVLPSTILHNGENYKVTSILASAFWADKITSIEIPNTVIDIEEKAFYNCRDLVSVVLPNTIRVIGESAFAGCEKLVEVKISENINEEFYRKGKIGDMAFFYCISLKSITLPNNISEIGNRAFDCCENLTSIELPDSLTVIGKSAFSNSGLTSVSFPKTLTSLSIEDYAFSKSGLTSVSFPEALTSLSIEDYAFNYCALTEIKIPKSATYISKDAFHGNFNISSIIIDGGNLVYDSRDNCNAIIETATDKLIIACQNTQIPTSVKVIGSGAFFNIHSITIKIPSKVQSLETDAISLCKNLNVVVEDGNDVLSGLSFYRCTINNFYLGRTIESASPLITLYNEDGYVKNLTIGKYVSKLSIDYLLGCSEWLESINVDKENTIYSSPDNCNAIISNADKTLLLGCKNSFIPNNVEVIGKKSFERTELQNISIPNNVKVIEEWAFGNTSLPQIEIPKTVETIEYYAFVGSGLRKIVFYGNPKTNKSFAGCEWVEEVRSYSKTPQECSFTNPDSEIIPGEGPFDVHIFNANLYVPKGTKALYKSLNEWKNFSNIYEFDTTGVDNVDNNDIEEVDRYDITGKLLTQPTKGVNIVKMSDGSIKKILVK